MFRTSFGDGREWDNGVITPWLKNTGWDVRRGAACNERSSHTWFVLKYLLGLNNVKNYDGSWTEYGNLVGAAIEKG
jgi:hypothetical protein